VVSKVNLEGCQIIYAVSKGRNFGSIFFCDFGGKGKREKGRGRALLMEKVSNVL
jgi:hypothetical protein